MFLFMEKVSFLKLRDHLKAIFVFDKRDSNNTNLGGINGEKNAQINHLQLISSVFEILGLK